MNGNIKRVLVYPPWVNFPFQWHELPELVLNPSRWSIVNEPESFASLGYTVSKDNHEFLSSSTGGGVICLNRDFGRWYPKILFNRVAGYSRPVGFGRTADIGVIVFVPKIKMEHNLGEEPMPNAPSPLYSIEKAILPKGQLGLLTVGDANSDQTFVQSIRGWGLLVERVESSQDCWQDPYRFACVKSEKYNWCTVTFEDEDPNLVIGLIVHAGLGHCNQKKPLLSRVHIFMDQSLANERPFSASRWPPRLRVVRTSDDW